MRIVAVEPLTGGRKVQAFYSTRQDADNAFDLLAASYEAKYPKAVLGLTRDHDELLAFHDFPAEHWMHIRTTNPMESTFATVRLRTVRTKGNGSRAARLAMVFKLTMCAEKTWRALNGSISLHCSSVKSEA